MNEANISKRKTNMIFRWIARLCGVLIILLTIKISFFPLFLVFILHIASECPPSLLEFWPVIFAPAVAIIIGIGLIVGWKHE